MAGISKIKKPHNVNAFMDIPSFVAALNAYIPYNDIRGGEENPLLPPVNISFSGETVTIGRIR